ncbi:MAG: hypothetical protein R2698_10035 [Microthrixaceae bacterium]
MGEVSGTATRRRRCLRRAAALMVLAVVPTSSIYVARPGALVAPGGGGTGSSPVHVLGATETRTVTSPEPPATGAQPGRQVPGAELEVDPTGVSLTGQVLARPEFDRAGLARAVLARIHFRWRERLPGWRIEFVGPRDGFRGSTFPRRKVIEVYRYDGSSLEDYVHVTAHELGHAIDVTLLDDEMRAAFNEARHRRADAAWWVEDGASDFESGAGDWAECFARSIDPHGRFYSRLGPPPDASQLAVIRAMIG